LTQDGEEIGHEGMHVGETGLSQITQQGKRRLANLEYNNIIEIQRLISKRLVLRETYLRQNVLHTLVE